MTKGMAAMRMRLVLSVLLLFYVGIIENSTAQELFRSAEQTPVRLLVSSKLEALEEYALSELTTHVASVFGSTPKIIYLDDVGDDDEPAKMNTIVLGCLSTSPLLQQLAENKHFEAPREEQGFSIQITPDDRDASIWRAILCGADARGVLYAVRDFCHYYGYRDGDETVVRAAAVHQAPTLKMRQLSESGCNLFSAANPNDDFMYYVHLNAFSTEVVFNKQHFVDWLSEWKMNQVTLIWCNFDAYANAFGEFIDYAHTRGIKVYGFYVPFRPGHEGPPASITQIAKGKDGGANSDCPRDPAARAWYQERLKELVNRKPSLDGLVIESPYHDGVACPCDACSEDPYPEDRMLEEMFAAVRESRPEFPIVRCIKHNITSDAAGTEFAAQLKELEGPNDWYMNTFPNRESRQRWHALGPRFATYLRPYREVLKGGNVPEEIGGLFSHFQDSARQGVASHGFCYRFYGGRLGSFRIAEDRALQKKYSNRRGAFSMALVAEAAFNPFLDGEERAHRIARIHALTIPDYPRDRAMTTEELSAIGLPAAPTTSQGPVMADPAGYTPPSALLRTQYSIQEPGFLIAQICADVNNDGTRNVVYASRGTGKTHLLRAADGSVVWSRTIPGDHQSIMAHDLDGDKDYEIIYTTSDPGRLYVLEGATGAIEKTWEAQDWKVGNSPVIADGNGDGILDGYLGTRSSALNRINMEELCTIASQSPWVQCGCHTSALDVDRDGHWDLFAGSGDDTGLNGVAYRYNPVTLEPVWQIETNDNASSADMVLVDINNDGDVEIIKSVDNYAKDDAHDAIYAWNVNGTHRWSASGFSGEDSPNVADLDGDGRIEIVGMTFGNEVYCLNSDGTVRWQKDLRPDIDNSAHAYMTPVLCDTDGKPGLEILALTNDGYFEDVASARDRKNGIIFVLNAVGDVLDQYDVGAPRFWGTAFVCNVDDDPQLELLASGSGGFDVIETQGFGANLEHFQRRRTYQRLNVMPWAYEDTYFIYRGEKINVMNRTDNLVLAQQDGRYIEEGRFTTELLTLPPSMIFDQFSLHADVPDGASLHVSVLDEAGRVLCEGIQDGDRLALAQSIRLHFEFATNSPARTPLLDAYRLQFSPLLKEKSGP
jgi:hypothetical protein